MPRGSKEALAAQAAVDGALHQADLQDLLPLVPPTSFRAGQALWHATPSQLLVDRDDGVSLWADTPSKFDELRRSFGLELEQAQEVWFAYHLFGAIHHLLANHAAQLGGSMRVHGVLRGHTQLPHVSVRAGGTATCMEDMRLWPPTAEVGPV